MITTIHKALEALNVSIRELSYEANVSRTTICNLIEGRYSSSHPVIKTKVETAINFLRNNEIKNCQQKIQQLEERVELLKKIQIHI